MRAVQSLPCVRHWRGGGGGWSCGSGSGCRAKIFPAPGLPVQSTTLQHTLTHTTHTTTHNTIHHGPLHAARGDSGWRVHHQISCACGHQARPGAALQRCADRGPEQARGVCVKAGDARCQRGCSSIHPLSCLPGGTGRGAGRTLWRPGWSFQLCRSSRCPEPRRRWPPLDRAAQLQLHHDRRGPPSLRLLSLWLWRLWLWRLHASVPRALLRRLPAADVPDADCVGRVQRGQGSTGRQWQQQVQEQEPGLGRPVKQLQLHQAVSQWRTRGVVGSTACGVD